jgi:LPLT family lysophospholipid transporter-like MFS transporter
MLATLGAQFLSALADNALIFAALALVHQKSYPSWTGPLLQEFFIGTYILLAPFVGAFADTHSKARVMLFSNVTRFAGGLCMCLGVNPFLSYALVGAGAAGYSPAKYGILGELTRPELLVKANGLLESATIASIILGAVVGGALADWSVQGALIVITAGYAAAALSTLAIPHHERPQTDARFSPLASIRTFAVQTRTFLAIREARLTIIGTALFWGAGAALRFLVIAWTPVGLHIDNNRMPGFLTGMVAAGIVVGAGLAARFVKLETVNRALPSGILLGVTVCFLPLAHTLTAAFIVMAFAGIFSGFFVVPLDALLQKRGEECIGVGSAIAIQNLFENVCMLVTMSAYTAVMFAGVPVNAVAVMFGITIAASMSLLALARPRTR